MRARLKMKIMYACLILNSHAQFKQKMKNKLLLTSFLQDFLGEA